ncbi:diguanylate cyclase (GGDEF)-like protein [Paenibacillus baekrokdamisoli]|nr:diguanylate cyclase (GGDEF)-like protein [Paenibacillus baekrokdamisoli]
MTWLDISLFLILFVLFAYVFVYNVITRLHKVYLLFHFFMMIWPLGQVAVHTTDNPQLQLTYITISFVGLSMIGFGWLLFSNFLINQSYMPRRRSLFYMVLPALLVAIGIASNPWNSFVEAVDGRYEERIYGPIFWLMLAVLLGYFIYSLCLLWRASHSVSTIQDRSQIANALLGIFILIFFTVLDLTLNVLLDPWLPVIPGLTSLGIVLSDIYFIISIQKHRMFDRSKISQQLVVDTIAVGILVLDNQDHVIEMNPRVVPQLGIKLGDRLDMDNIMVSFSSNNQTEEFLQAYWMNPFERLQTEICFNNADKPNHLSLNVAPIIADKRIIGRVITFQDISELRGLIDESKKQYVALQERNRALMFMQDELFQANQKLERMAITDGLTGCFNRRYLMQQLEHEVMINVRYRIPFAIFLFDIDLFKTVNDRYGHPVGDEVIRRTADIVRSVLRRTDILARYGGEEFTVYLPHTNRAQAEMLAQRIRTAVESNKIPSGVENTQISVTISMGVIAIEEPLDVQLLDAKAYLRELFVNVDAALYKAKDNGRNRVVNF